MALAISANAIVDVLSRVLSLGGDLESSDTPIVAPDPAPTPENTFANSTAVYANSPAFSSSLLALQQRLAALGY